MDIEQILKDRTSHHGFAQDLGIEVTKAKDGSAEGHMKIEPRHLNPQGNVHGGCIFSLMDTIGGVAAISRGDMTVTSSSNILFLNAAAGTSTLRAVATEVKNGRTLKIYTVEALDDKGVLVAKAEMTFFATGKLDLERLAKG